MVKLISVPVGGYHFSVVDHRAQGQIHRFSVAHGPICHSEFLFRDLYHWPPALTLQCQLPVDL